MKIQSKLGVTISSTDAIGTFLEASQARTVTETTYTAAASWQTVYSPTIAVDGDYFVTFSFTFSAAGDADVEFRIIDTNDSTVYATAAKAFISGRLDTVTIPAVITKGAASTFALQLYSATHNVTSYQDLVNDVQDYASRFIKIRVN